MSDRLAELREQLCKPPSDRTWRMLLSMLEFWPDDDEREMALSYADAHLEQWPDELRVLSSTQHQTPCWQIARHLRLTRKHIDDDGLTQLANNPLLANIKSLSLGYNDFGPKGLQYLAHSPYAANLTLLLMHKNQVGNAGAEALAQSPQLGQLTSLHLRNTGLEDGAAIALANAAHFGRLECLDLSDNEIGNPGFIPLLTTTHLPLLQALHLERNQIGDMGINQMLNLPSLPPQLQKLYLSGNPLSTSAKDRLLRHPLMDEVEIYYM